MGPQGNYRQQLVAERSQLPRRDKPLGGFLGEEVQHFPTRPWYVRHINLVPFETYQKGQLNPNWLILIAFSVSLSKQKLSKKTTKTATTLFFSTISNIFCGRKICKKLDRRNSQGGTSNFCTAGGTPGQVVGCMVLEKKHFAQNLSSGCW